MISISKINNKTSFGQHQLGKMTSDTIKALSEMKSPAQRVVIGATALILQPLIDSLNPGIDKKTKETSMARSVAKAVICTSTGIVMRSGFIKLATKLSQEGKAFFPKALKNITNAEERAIKFGNYTNAVGTVLALIAMLVTNFVVDAPLTNWAQNKITKHVFHHEETPKQEARQ